MRTEVTHVWNDFFSRGAIEEGKAIFHNIRNFVRFQLSTFVSFKKNKTIVCLFNIERFFFKIFL